MAGATSPSFLLINMPIMKVQVTVAKICRGKSPRFTEYGNAVTHETKVFIGRKLCVERMRIRASLQANVVRCMRIMAKETISSGKRRMLIQRFIKIRLLYRWQRFAFVVGLILIVTTKTKLRYVREQMIVNVGTMRIMASCAQASLYGTMNCSDTIRYDLIVAADAKRLRGELQESGIF